MDVYFPVGVIGVFNVENCPLQLEKTVILSTRISPF